ncbi:hypothetical protein COCNU_scaffold000960G000040 [Cocos nucifera]|nr:hypothetical protein [Cocos nucifera]
MLLFHSQLEEKVLLYALSDLSDGSSFWCFLRKLVRRAPSLDTVDLNSFNKLKSYQAPLLSNLLKELTLFNLHLSPLDLAEMDTEVVGMLTKSLYAQKRKRKASGESSKKVKIGASSSVAPVIHTTSTEVTSNVKAPPLIEISAVSANSLPPTSSCLHAGGQALEPPIKREKRDDKKKKKKSVVVKIVRKAHPGEPSDGNDDLGEDPFKNSKKIQDLTDKFAIPEVVDRMTDLDQT